MILVCESCGGLRELSPRALARLRTDERGKRRCPECGAYAAQPVTQSSSTTPKAPLEPDQPDRMPAPPPIRDLVGGEGEGDDARWIGRALMLRREGRVFRLRDLDRVRRLVVERKARASDMLSADGVSWVPLGSIPALLPFLEVMRHLSADHPASAGGLVDATEASAGWAAVPDDQPTEELAMDEVPALASPSVPPSSESDDE